MSPQITSLVIFVLVYAFIIFNVLPRSSVSLVGAFLLVVLGVLEPREIVSSINWDAIGLIFGMFILVRMLTDSGFFDFLSVKVLKLTKGVPINVLIAFALLTGLLAAFMDSITVLLFMSALSIQIAKKLKMSPVPFVLSQITAANIGGSATLMGDPPNIILGTGLGITLVQFIKYLAPISMAILLLNTLYFVLFYKKMFKKSEKFDVDYLKNLNPREHVKDYYMMVASMISFAVAIVLLILHEKINMPVAYAGLIGASLGLVLNGKKVANIWESIDWEVLLFFSTLFIIIGSLEKTGVIGSISKAIAHVSNGSALLTKGILLWMSGILSGVIDNVPFAASMVPVVKLLAPAGAVSLLSMGLIVSFGTDVGGNFTPIGASANVIGLSILSKAGIDVEWKEYLKAVVPITFINIFVAGVLFAIFYK
ncbi:MAG: SLC13 family permease [Patescibacteria group bacterium]